MNPLAIIRQFFQGLTAETTPGQIGAGITLGFLIGLMPKATLTAQVLIIVMMATRVNIPMAVLTVFAVSLVNPLLDKITDPLGYALLTSEALRPLWTKLYNMPLAPWTGFNNTVVPGGLVLGAPLLEKKLVVDSASLKGLRFGAARKTSGKLPFAKPEEPSPLVEDLKKESGDFALERASDAKAEAAADYKVDPAELGSVKLAKQLEESSAKDYEAISARLDTKKYEAGMEALKARYEKAKSEKNFARQARDYAEIGKEVKKLNSVP